MPRRPRANQEAAEREAELSPITVGFAELTEVDSARDLVNRADGDFLSAHRARGQPPQ